MLVGGQPVANSINLSIERYECDSVQQGNEIQKRYEVMNNSGPSWSRFSGESGQCAKVQGI